MASSIHTRYIQHQSTASVRPSDLFVDIGMPLFLVAPIQRAVELPLYVGNDAERVRCVLQRYEQLTRLLGLPGRRLWLQGTALEWVESQFQGWSERGFRRAQRALFRQGALVRACGDPRVLTALTAKHTEEATH